MYGLVEASGGGASPNALGRLGFEVGDQAGHAAGQQGVGWSLLLECIIRSRSIRLGISKPIQTRRLTSHRAQ
jgi:hypothetical protein